MGSLEINILDKNRQLLHSIDVFRTLIWTRCYTEPGRFDLYCYQPDFPRLREGVYLCTNRHKELGRIDTLKLLRSRHLAFISGSFPRRNITTALSRACRISTPTARMPFFLCWTILRYRPGRYPAGRY